MPDTVRTRSSHLIAPYVRTEGADQRIASARELVRLALGKNALSTTHRKHLLKLAQWWVTEADGKWKTRYKSATVLALVTQTPAPDVPINHEHVYGRAALADEILRDPSRAATILELCVGCVVTVDEHKRLSAQRNVQGWDRYRAADVQVCDTSRPGFPIVNLA